MVIRRHRARWLLALATSVATFDVQRVAGAESGSDEVPVVPVAFLAPEFDEPAPATTSGDDNIVYRLVHGLIPGGDGGPPPPCDIASPGPDTANFPNSPFTLPKGRSYVETLPGTFSLPGPDGTPGSWSWPFLIRTGLTDSCEFRILSQGPTVVGSSESSEEVAGFAPLVFDLKIHLWGDHEQLYVPAVGVEMFVQTGLASRPFQIGTESGMTLLVDHKLPNDWLFEWNAGLYGMGGGALPDEFSVPDFGAQWALQKQLTERLAVFYQGFYNASGIPFFPSDIVSGIGMQWNVSQRFAVFTSYNWSLDGIGSPSGGYSGFAYAY